MLLRRLYHARLAQSTYLIGCGASGEAIVIDPLRDVDRYIETAAAEGVRIVAVTETHVHADFLSGSAALARRTGAQLYLSGEGRGPWSYSDAYVRDAGAEWLQDGSTIQVGRVRIIATHTPGHTPEHLSFLVIDTPSATEPMGAVTGDFVFVGDVGRPDLLERAVRVTGSADAAARALHGSLARFAGHADYLQLWPGHSAGSACGKDLSAVPQSTLGYERRHNWAFRIADEDAFVRAVLEGQPEPPAYFAEMKRANAAGSWDSGDTVQSVRLTPDALAAAIARRTRVIDTRPAAEFAAGHILGTINIPLDRSFLTWAGSLIPLTAHVTVIVDEMRRLEVVAELRLIGIDHVVGHAGPDIIESWARSGRSVERLRQATVDVVAEHMRRRTALVVDVRGAAEWRAGHIASAAHMPLGALGDRMGELPRDRLLVVQCQSGSRSAIAASVLRAAGFTDVVDLRGGLTAWCAAGHDIVADATA